MKLITYESSLGQAPDLRQKSADRRPVRWVGPRERAAQRLLPRKKCELSRSLANAVENQSLGGLRQSLASGLEQKNLVHLSQVLSYAASWASCKNELRNRLSLSRGFERQPEDWSGLGKDIVGRNARA